MNDRPRNLFGFKVKTFPVKENVAQFLDSVRDDSSLMPLEIDLKELKVVFYQLRRAGYRGSSFLREDSFYMPGAKAYGVDIKSFLSCEKKILEFPSCPGSFIFHHGFGGSTYLANFLMDTGKFNVFKEPGALEKLTVLKNHNKLSQEEHDALFSLLMRIYLKKPSFNERVSVKAGNAPLLDDAFLKNFPHMKIIFLYQELEDLLVGVNKEERKGFCEYGLRTAFFGYVIKGKPISELLDEIKGRDFYYFAALYWFMINYHMELVSSKTSSCYQLPASSLYSKPEESLKKAASFLGENLSDEAIMSALNNKLLTERHSKDPFKVFDGKKDKLRKENKKKTMKKEIKLAKEYAESLRKRFYP